MFRSNPSTHTVTHRALEYTRFTENIVRKGICMGVPYEVFNYAFQSACKFEMKSSLILAIQNVFATIPIKCELFYDFQILSDRYFNSSMMFLRKVIRQTNVPQSQDKGCRKTLSKNIFIIIT